MDIITFGEALFRLSTVRGERLAGANRMNFHLGGTELNIAANLTTLGVPSAWVSALPDGPTGELMREKIASLGVGMSAVKSVPFGRPGWYLMETGATPRPDLVLGRYASSMSEIESFSFDWDHIFQGARIFHTSGVAAGLSEALTGEIKRAMVAAKNLELLVSYDFNYRKNLWSLEESQRRQSELLPFVDILFCSESDLSLFFGKDPSSNDYAKIFEKRRLQMLVISQRDAEETEYGVKVVTKELDYKTRRYPIQNVDRIGVGDSMAAGFLASWIKTGDFRQAGEWASACGSMKYGIAGDMALLHEREVRSLLETGPRSIVR